MKISKQKQEKICEQILSFLFHEDPRPRFTAHIAAEIARDEEFVKRLLSELKQKKLVLEIKQNAQGIRYTRRSRWKLTRETHQAYSKQQI